MGGKAKQANRTKNNVRPSSSGRSAEMISSQVNPSLVQVGPGTVLPAVFPSLAGPTLDHPLSNEFLLCFKKFHKKDPITKLKALNELKGLVIKSQQAEVVNALASWAHYYPTLTVDMDRKVREATQACHGEVVRKCGRRVAPQLRRLLPAWLIARHDEYAPAQLLAQKLLEETFPNERLAEAIKFCKAEIMNLYLDNLKGGAVYMLNGKTIGDEEERSAQVARVAASTLRALQALCSALPAELEPWLWDALLPLLCATAYWQLAGHASPAVRAAWYSLTGALVVRLAARLPAELARRCARTLLAHAESTPAAGAERWSAVLLFMTHVPDWLTHMDKKDLLCKRLLDMLENAAWGEPLRLATLLLPLLERLPADMLTKDFYNSFFNAMFAGLNHKLLVPTKLGHEQWSALIAKCVRYVSARHQGENFAAALVSGTHRAWLQAALCATEGAAKPHLVRITAAHMSGLAAHWLHRAKHGDLIYDQMVRNFWLNIGATMSAQVEQVGDDVKALVKLCETHTFFVTIMKLAFGNAVVKGRRITFEIEPLEPDWAPDSETDSESDSVPDSVPETDSGSESIPIDEATSGRFLHNLEGAMEMLVGFYFDAMETSGGAQRVVPALLPMMRAVRGRGVWLALAQRLGAEPLYTLYARVLRAWLADEARRSAALVELVFMLARHLSDEEKNAVFDSFEEFPGEVVEWCLAAALVGSRRDDPCVRRWLRGDAVHAAMAGLARREHDDDARALLLAALAPKHHGVLVSDHAVIAVVATCSSMLNSLIAYDAEITLPEDERGWRAPGPARPPRRRDAPDHCARLEPRVRFSTHVLGALPAASALPLMLSLFRLTLRVPVLERMRHSPRLTKHVWCAALFAWRNAVQQLAAAERARFVQDAVRYLHWHLLHDLNTLDVDRIEHVASLCPCLVLSADGAEGAVQEAGQRVPQGLAGEEGDPGGLLMLSRLVLDVRARSDPPLLPLEVFALQLDVIWGDISCPFEDDNEWVVALTAGELTLDKRTLITHAYRALFRALYVREMLQLAQSDAYVLVPLGVDAPDALGMTLLHARYFRNQVCHVARDCAVFEVLHDHYAFWIHYSIICETKRRLDKILKQIATRVPLETGEQLMRDLDQRGDAHGYYWSRAKRVYRRVLEDEPAPPPRAPDDDDTDQAASVADSTVDAMDSSELDTVRDDDSDHTDTEESAPSSSFEVVEPTDVFEDEEEELCQCEKGLYDYPSTYDDLEERTRDILASSETAQPDATDASPYEEVAVNVEPLTDTIMRNGFYHEAQMNALEVKWLKEKAKAFFDKLQDDKLSKFEINGQHKIFERWNDEPSAYRVVRVNVDEEIIYRARDRAMMRAYYSEYARVAPAIDPFLADIAVSRCSLDAVINGYYQYNDTLFLEKDLSTASWLQLNCTAAVADLLAIAVSARGWDAHPAHWDFTNIVLCGALSSLAHSTAMYTTAPTRLALVARPVLELYVSVRRFVASVRTACIRCQPSEHVAALPAEWADVFARDAARSLCLFIYHVLKSSCKCVSASQVALLRGLAEAIAQVEPSALHAALAAAGLPAARLGGLAACSLASTAHHGYKFLGYYTLRALAPELIEVDLASLRERAALAAQRPGDEDLEGDSGDLGEPELTMELYHDHFLKLQELVDVTLGNYVVCSDMCELEPMSDSYLLVLGYLLLGVALHRQCEMARGDLALHYVNHFADETYVEGILSVTLKLLPPSVLHYMTAALPAMPKRYKAWFIRLEDFDVRDPVSAVGVSRLACGLVFRALGGPGGSAARGWHGRAREAGALRRLCAAAVAPALVNHQLTEVKRYARTLGSRVKVAVSLSGRALVCSLRGNERAMRLCVRLSAAHPLGAPRVQCAPLGPDPHYLSLYLGYRNGRLVEVVRMWAESAGAVMAGSAPCSVCYCREHIERGGLPTVSCRQCHNNFHSHCLRRWFTTCSRSNCPVCRTNF